MGAAAVTEATQRRGRERVNCVRDAKSDQMKNEQQTAVIDDQNGEEEREREREEDRKRIEESKEGGAIKQGIGTVTVGFCEDVGIQMIHILVNKKLYTVQLMVKNSISRTSGIDIQCGS